MKKKSDSNYDNSPFQERNERKGEFVVETFAKTPFTADMVGERRFKHGKPAGLIRDPESLPDMSKGEPQGNFAGNEPDPIGILPWNRK